MKLKNIYWFYLVYCFYLVAVTIGGMLLIEFVSQQINAANGVELPFIGFRSGLGAPEPLGGQIFSVLDPQLGFARRNPEASGKWEKQYYWINGFAVYGRKEAALKHPVILTLGGSTTDGIEFDHSWPEELSKILVEKGINGTVVNGGTGGYSTNQELLKLLRDGLEFKPDIIISYSGVNDRGDYGELPYPMVHTHQRDTLNFLTSGTR